MLLRIILGVNPQLCQDSRSATLPVVNSRVKLSWVQEYIAAAQKEWRPKLRGDRHTANSFPKSKQGGLICVCKLDTISRHKFQGCHQTLYDTPFSSVTYSQKCTLHNEALVLLFILAYSWILTV